MDNKYYTIERNCQIVISLLKAHGIKYIIVSPGTTHMCFVGSIQHDSFFSVYSCVDERSAAYMACGLAAESGEPVVITCTGATASRNYLSALTEAYYRKLPIIAITAHQGTDRIGHLLEQNIDRRAVPLDVVKTSVEAIFVDNKRDEQFCEIEVNKAILECQRHGGGPVHINIFTHYSKDFTVKELPPVKVIKRYTAFRSLPAIPKGKVAIFVGSHKKFSADEIKAIDSFCATYDAVAFCDHTSGYYGKYRVLFSLPLAQKFYEINLRHIDLLIHIGEVSGDTNTFRNLKPKEVWRVSEDGEIRDSWRKLSAVFEMSEEFFFKSYAKQDSNNHSFLDECLFIQHDTYKKVCDMPLSNVWVAQQLSSKLPKGCCFHTGIWSCLRSFNFFETQEGVTSACNVGGFGIDGNLSSLIGASLCASNKLYFGIVGDLSFFYDMTVLGNRHIGNNVRIAIINNGRGNEMRYRFSPASSLGEEGNNYLAASGHFHKQSRTLVKHYAEDLGFDYISATTKEEFLSQYEYFLCEKKYEKPLVFEIFIDDYLDEDRAYNQITTIEVDKTLLMKGNIKTALKSVVGEKNINTIKKIVKR